MQRLTSLAAALLLVWGFGGTAIPANAATSIAVALNCPLNNNIVFSRSSVNADLNDTIQLSVNGPWEFNVVAVGASGPPIASGFTNPNNYLVTGNTGGSLTLSFRSGSCTAPSATLTIVGSVAPPDGGGTESPNVVPVLETLTIQTTTGNTTCTGGSPTGYRGEWMTLPSADECTQTGPKADPSAKLLGWATDPNFPVAIAQRQVNNGWGAYETFNEDGQLTGVFIPAGGATFVSGSNNLYPIWSK